MFFPLAERVDRLQAAASFPLPMTDPTADILSASLLISLFVFLVGAGLRFFFKGRDTWEVSEISEAGDVVVGGDPMELPPPLPEDVVVEKELPIRHCRSIDFLWMGFLFLTFSGLSLAAAKLPEGEARLPGPADLIASMGVHLVLAGMTVGFVAWRLGPVKWLGLRWKQWKWVFLIAPGTVMAMWVVFGLLAASGYMEWIQKLGGDAVQDTVKLLQTTKDPQILILMALAAVVVAPVCEEIVFRGYLYPAAKRFAGTWAAAISTALLFSAAHGNLGALLPLFIFGLVIIYVYERTRSIWAPIAIHFCFNGATVVIQVLAPYLIKLQEQA